MNGDRIEMSQSERDRLKVMSSVLEGKRTQVEAGRLLGLCERQVRRIQRRLEKEGDSGIMHRQRGRSSHRAKSTSVRQAVLKAYGQRYKGFGPTLAAEKLREDGLLIDHETLRRWLLSQGLWERKRKRDKHRSRRVRRECFGELVQGDGSHHDWLEGRGPWMVLVAFIDDATSKVTARFYPGETTEAYMDLLARYLRKHGRMVAMYVDRDSIFRVEDRHPDDPRPQLTQFSRALQELDIELILAYSPQAKGRIERFFQTAQDRLVKELRLRRARTIEQANEVLEKYFLPSFNRWRTVKPASPNDAHRRLHQSIIVDSILSIQESRKVCNDYTIRLDNQVYQLLKPALPGLRGGRVVIEKRLDNTLHIRFKKHYLAYHRIEVNKMGALPPNPRSLSHVRTPADKKKAQAAATAGPSAVRPANGRWVALLRSPIFPKAREVYQRQQHQVHVLNVLGCRTSASLAHSQSGHFNRVKLPDILKEL